MKLTCLVLMNEAENDTKIKKVISKIFNVINIKRTTSMKQN